MSKSKVPFTPLTPSGPPPQSGGHTPEGCPRDGQGVLGRDKMLLSEDERTTLLALANQRQQLIAEVDRLSRAVGQFGKLCAFVRGLPREASYDFEQRGQKDLALVALPSVGAAGGVKKETPA